MASASSKINPNWAEHIMENHWDILTHGNYPKTKVIILSSDPQRDENLVQDLKKDPRTDKVIYEVLAIKDFCADNGDFKDEKIKKEFMRRIENDLKPTLVLIDPNHRVLNDTLKINHLLDQGQATKTGMYNCYETQNITVVEPVILTFSMWATTDQVGEILKKMLKQNNFPNEAFTRILWIDGGHGARRQGGDGEFIPVGSHSGLTDEYYLNSEFYKDACRHVGIRSHPTNFKYHTRATSYETRGDFIEWDASALPSFPRPDMCKDPVMLQNPGKNSIVSDPELNKMKISVLNIADYHNRAELRGTDPATVQKRSEEFLRDVENFSPTAIFIGWCFSSNGDVALALRASPIFSIMLLENDVRQISQKNDAKLDSAQREIVGKISNSSIRHCVLAGSSGTGKTLIAAEFVKIKAAMLLRGDTDISVEIIICRLYAGSVDKSHLYQVWKDKYFHAVQGFQITYVSVRDLCKRFNKDYVKYVDYENKKWDIVGLITAVCEECDKQNTAKADTSKTIFMLDEARVNAVDKVCDYRQLSKLDKYPTILSVTCVNPREMSLSDDVFTVALPQNCSVPCKKGSEHNCIFSAQLNICYRNASEMRQFLQFWSDHGDALLSRENDQLGASLPPGLTGEQSTVTWVQCESLVNVEKTATAMVDKLEKLDKDADIVILYRDDKEQQCRTIANTVKGKHKSFDYRQFFGCECDVVIYITNVAVQAEAISRPRKKLAIITGPGLTYISQLRLKLLAAAQHSYTSLYCPDEPCPWSDGWTPLLEHMVLCGNCGQCMERRSEDCSQCGHKYQESSVYARAAVRSQLKYFVEHITKTSVTQEEVDDLCKNDELVNLVKQYTDARESNDTELRKTLWTQLNSLIRSISANALSATRAEQNCCNSCNIL